MNSSESLRQESLKRRWQEKKLSAIDDYHNHRLMMAAGTPPSPFMGIPNSNHKNTNSNNLLRSFSCGFHNGDDLVSNVIPAVTVVLEGRSICQRISLHKHANYQSLAKALHQMFVESGGGGGATLTSASTSTTSASDQDLLDLSNAIPGHVIAYEDIENDLLLVGDLNWKDFVRVAKRIRILPAKSNSRKGRE